MQSDLLGAYATGVSNLLLTTGEPLNPVAEREVGVDLEVDSIGAVNLADRLNHGVDVGGNPFHRPTAFHVGVRIEPTAHDLEREVGRYRWKVDAGAEFVVSVPVFDPEALFSLLDRLESIRVPVIASLWPLGSSREAEFFEFASGSVPVAGQLVERMRRAEQDDRAEEEGIEIGREIAEAIRPRVEGLQVVVPDGRYPPAWRLLEAIESLETVS
jgi:homocysteine S-methyltransferase